MANKTSPYFKTDIVEDYLDVIEMPAITQNNNETE